jgi:uncharacterized protein YdeI (YjbR/CyaY-like superfamily)
MSAVATVAAVVQITNVAFELVAAGQMIFAKIREAQEKRKAAGTELTMEDLTALMNSGDVAAALAKAKLAQAQIDLDAS